MRPSAITILPFTSALSSVVVEKAPMSTSSASTPSAGVANELVASMLRLVDHCSTGVLVPAPPATRTSASTASHAGTAIGYRSTR